MNINITTEGGYCPVQIEGYINNYPFYFRARGSKWSLSIADDVATDPLDSDTSWFYTEPYGTDTFSAGHMPLEEAKSFLNKAANIWLLEKYK